MQNTDSYPTDDEITRSLLALMKKKEFYSVKDNAKKSIEFEYRSRLHFAPHQIFGATFMNIHTDAKRIAMIYSTGSGKTITAIKIATNFIDAYKKMYEIASLRFYNVKKHQQELDQMIPSVFVLGFEATRKAFMGELINHPEFGFLSPEEYEEMLKLYKLSKSGVPVDIARFNEFINGVRRKISNKFRGGFYKFYGYQEFVNKLFLGDVKLTDVEINVQRARAKGEDITLESAVAKLVEENKIRINAPLIAQFRNSLLICDETHNTYNMQMRNNYGVAIQYVLDHMPSLRAVFLTATPINNSPTEIVDFINYLLPSRVTKRDLFDSNGDFLPSALDRIGRLSFGKISYLQDLDVKFFPERRFVGEEIPAVPYLKFVRCKMSEYHLETIKLLGTRSIDEQFENVRSADDEAGIDERLNSVIPSDGQSIYDIAFPAPSANGKSLASSGIFRSREVYSIINSAGQEFRDKIGVGIKKISNVTQILSGSFLQSPTLAQYSGKYNKMVELITEIIGRGGGVRERCEKIMIYHDRVRMSGVLLIQEILKENGFLDETLAPVENSICNLCGSRYSTHKKLPLPSSLTPLKIAAHEFAPCRFATVYSELERAQIDNTMSTFNHESNMYGGNIRIFIGSSIIKEGYNFKEVQNLFVMSAPVGIPSLIQVFGRCIRKNSHANLPQAARKVDIHILVSSGPKDSLSLDEQKYKNKLADYTNIQRIEKELAKYAIDADLHRSTIMSDSALAQYFPAASPTERAQIEERDNSAAEADAQNSIGPLYYKPAVKIPQQTLADLQTTTFNAHGHHKDEISEIIYLIKRAFLQTEAWTYDELWKFVTSTPIYTNHNPRFYAEENFCIALSSMCERSNVISSVGYPGEYKIIDKLFDPNDKIIYKNGIRCKIIYRAHAGREFYIVVPVRSHNGNIPDTESADAETYIRPLVTTGERSYDINNFVTNFVRGVEISDKINYYCDKFALEGSDNFAAASAALYYEPEEFQAQFLQRSIESSVARGKFKKSKFEPVLDFFAALGACVRYSDIKKYKHVNKFYEKFKIADDLICGYLHKGVIKMLVLGGDVSESKDNIIDPLINWAEINRESVNLQSLHKENTIVIGYFEPIDGIIKFKLRRPFGDLKSQLSTQKDTRLVSRGIVCETKPKREIIKIAASVGISVSKISSRELKIKSICKILRSRLIDLEIKERAKHGQMGVKWVYFWFDIAPKINKIELER